MGASLPERNETLLGPVVAGFRKVTRYEKRLEKITKLKVLFNTSG